MTVYGRMGAREYTAWLNAGGANQKALVPSPGGTVTRLGPPSSAAVIEAKAATGFGVTALTYSTPLWTLQRTPQQIAFQAAALFGSHDVIRKAEAAVSGRAGNVDWHLEDDNDEEITDASAPNLRAPRDLLEKPQAALPLNQRQAGMNTRRGMWTTTIRHMGLCGTSFWYLDQTDALAGIPLAILYIAPWRLYTVTNAQGGLLGWSLDHPLDEGGSPLRLEDVLPFYLQPPDQGYFATGLVAAAATKIPLTGIVDRHVANVIGNGGRLTGLLSPKEGSTVTDDQWQSFIKDYRQITADPNAAQRLQIVKGPVDYVRTAATMDELAIVEIDQRVNDAILSLWGVPGSQTGEKAPAGLNSGSTKGFDEAILWQGPIDARLQSFYETVQYGLLDRYKAAGVSVELELEPPSFDDDTPLYQRATQAANIPLSNDERRAIVGQPPFDPAIYGDYGKVVLLPTTLAEVAGPGVAEKLAAQQAAQAQALANAQQAQTPDQQGVTMPPEETDMPMKATLDRISALRRTLDRITIPKVKRAVSDVLASQRADVIAYLRKAGLDHLRRKVEFRWDAKRADAQLVDALKPELASLTGKVTERTRAILPHKAALDDFTVAVLEQVLLHGAARVSGINRTTRDAVAEAISLSLKDANTIEDVIQAVEALDIFGHDRAEVIARTESMLAYNNAALQSYAEMGVTEVQAIDGDQDEMCAERHGRTFTLAEADVETAREHPNGTLDWVPIIPDEVTQ